MSLKPKFNYEQCACGAVYETDSITNSIGRDKCGLCTLLEWIDSELDVVMITRYITLTALDKVAEANQIVSELLQGKLPDQYIIVGSDHTHIIEAFKLLGGYSMIVSVINADIKHNIKCQTDLKDYVDRMIATLNRKTGSKYECSGLLRQQSQKNLNVSKET